MKKILVVGWDASLDNFGDKILIDTVTYLIKKAGDYEAKRLDWVPSKAYWRLHLIKGCYLKSIQFIVRLFDKFGSYEKNSLLGNIKYTIKKYYYSLKLKKFYCENMDNIEAVIIAGGAPLKYETQDQSFYTQCLVEATLKNNKPMMINATGIEQYSNNDIRCIKLIECINNSTIKCITTRYDYKKLSENFIKNKSIVIAQVADPALWIPETYGIYKRDIGEVIGINLIRNNIFKDYSRYYMENDDVYNLYIGIADELERRGYNWRFFCNGMAADYEFGLEVLKRMKKGKEYILPVAKTTKEYVNQVAKFKAVIGGRMHATIASYALGIPVVAFIWSIKMRLFADNAKIGKYYIEKENITSVNLVDAMEESMKDNDMSEYRKEYRQSTFEYIKRFCDSIQG